MKIRKVTPFDVEQVAQFMREYFPEAVIHSPLLTRDKFVAAENYIDAWAKKVCNHDNLISFIADDGMILGELAETWIGPNKVARGGIWYVRPRARGGLLAWRLFEAFDNEARSRGAICARMDIDNPVFMPVVEKMCAKRGFKEYSKIFVKEYC